MAIVSFVILGNPLAKKRHRSKILGGRIMSYDLQQKEKKDVSTALLSSFREQGFLTSLTGNISVKFEFHTQIPKSLSDRKKEALSSKPNCKRPDIDNYIKFYLDCMNKKIFLDDGQVFDVKASKIYSLQPKTIIWVSCNEKE